MHEPSACYDLARSVSSRVSRLCLRRMTFAIVAIGTSRPGVDTSGACYARTICSDLRIGNVRDIGRSVSNTAVL